MLDCSAIKTFRPLLVLSLLLSGCALQKRHIPHYVDNIPERAQVIAKQTRNLTPQVVVLALSAYNKVQGAGYGEKHLLTIIDYSKPSNCDRFWVINLDSNVVLFRELVAHGKGSGELYATSFSNQIDSKSTSLGMYLTAPAAYMGRHGYSLRLKGLEPGFNGNAWARAIVIHPAPYVCPEYIQRHGEVGQSWGCPALNPQDVKAVIRVIQGNTLVFAYGNDPKWLQYSPFLH